jgi:hypothetical protein
VTEEIKSLDLGFQPEGAVSGAVLLQSEVSTTLTCNARQEINGRMEPAGTAVIEFEICHLAKFGHPNDEAWTAIPRTKGLSYGFYEVVGSAWPEEVARLNRYAFPASTSRVEKHILALRHFLALFHDSSFECLAKGWKSRLSTDPVAELLSDIAAKIARE